MSNLILKENLVYSPTLNEEEKRIVRNSVSEKVKDIDEKELKIEVFQCIQLVLMNIGQKNLENEDKKVMAMQLCSQILIDFPHIKIDEVTEALKNGSFGKYRKNNEAIYFSPANAISWINQYQNEKHSALHKQLQFQEQEKIKQDELERIEALKKEYYTNMPQKVFEAVEGSEMAKIWLNEFISWGIVEIEKEVAQIFRKKAEESIAEYVEEKRRQRIKLKEESIEELVKNKAKEMYFFYWLDEIGRDKAKEMIENKIKELKLI